jgi:hypothetical protein
MPPTVLVEPGRVRLVDHHPRVVAVRDVTEFRERRDRPVHREHGVRDDEPRPAVVPCRHSFAEVVRVAVVVHDDVRVREPARVHDARVIQFVREDDVRVECGDGADVRRVSRGERECALAALRLREPPLEVAVDERVARHEPGRPRARSDGVRGLRRRLLYAVVLGQAEVVVRREHELAFAGEHRKLTARVRCEVRCFRDRVRRLKVPVEVVLADASDSTCNVEAVPGRPPFAPGIVVRPTHLSQ